MRSYLVLLCLFICCSHATNKPSTSWGKLALQQQKKGNIERAIKFYKKAVEKGDKFAEKQLLELNAKSTNDKNKSEKNSKTNWHAPIILENPFEGLLKTPEDEDKIKAQAAKGNPRSQYIYGNICLIGKTIKKNFKRALKLYKQAADHKIAGAHYQLGIMHKLGLGTPKDKTLADKWFKSAFALFNTSSKNSSPFELYALGSLYRFGLGVEKDLPKAIKLLKKAGELGSNNAQSVLGTMFMLGAPGFPKNVKKAFYWYSKAEESENISAKFNLGKMYYHGIATPKNYRKAFSLIRYSSDKGYPPSQSYLANMYALGQGCNKNLKLAIELHHKAAKQNQLLSLFVLGRMYLHGSHEKKDYHKALGFLEPAAEKNHPEAQFYVGYMYRMGLGIPKNAEKAIYWYTKAAENNQKDAQTNLGVIYTYAEDIPQDLNLAKKWFKKAAEQNDEKAMYNLIEILKQEGTFESLDEAEKWTKIFERIHKKKRN
jgi:TPR repeat protein